MTENQLRRLEPPPVELVPPHRMGLEHALAGMRIKGASGRELLYQVGVAANRASYDLAQFISIAQFDPDGPLGTLLLRAYSWLSIVELVVRDAHSLYAPPVNLGNGEASSSRPAKKRAHVAGSGSVVPDGPRGNRSRVGDSYRPSANRSYRPS